MWNQTTDCDVGCLWASKEKGCENTEGQRTQKNTENTEGHKEPKGHRGHRRTQRTQKTRGKASELIWQQLRRGALPKPREEARKSSREKAMLSSDVQCTCQTQPALSLQLSLLSCPSSCRPSFHFSFFSLSLDRDLQTKENFSSRACLLLAMTT